MMKSCTKRIISLFMTVATVATILFAAPIAAQEAKAWSPDPVVYANSDPNKYQIQVDLTNKVITVYEKDKVGKFSKIAKQFICTLGTDETPTPAGYFYLNDRRRRFGYFTKFDVYAQYWVQVSGGIYFHSILYTQPKEGYFTKTSFNALGKKSSHGCIRMLVEDARWLYYNCPAGTYGVMVYNKKNDSLRKSLLPTISASKYKPEADQYENSKRGYSKAKVKVPTTFSSTSGSSVTVPAGTFVSVLSSGQKSCKIQINGKTGYIATNVLEFYPNGPKDKQIAEGSREIGYIKSKEATLYKVASEEASVLGTYGKNTTAELIGSTKSFYKVIVDGKTGYILKTAIDTKVVSNYKAVVNEIKPEVQEPEETATPDIDEVDDTTTDELAYQEA